MLVLLVGVVLFGSNPQTGTRGSPVGRLVAILVAAVYAIGFLVLGILATKYGWLPANGLTFALIIVLPVAASSGILWRYYK